MREGVRDQLGQIVDKHGGNYVPNFGQQSGGLSYEGDKQLARILLEAVNITSKNEIA